MKNLKNISVSHGTLVTEHLIEAFMRVIKEHDPLLAYQIETAPENALWFKYEDTDVGNEMLHEDLFPAMQSIAPEDCCFGSHPGDGSDFGFWEIDLFD